MCALGVEKEVVNSTWAGWSDGHRVKRVVKKSIQAKKVIWAKVKK